MATNGTNGHFEGRLTAATKLRRMIEDPNNMVMLPGVYDGFSARVALEVGGFDALYMVRNPPLSLDQRNHKANFNLRPAQAQQPPASATQTWASPRSTTCAPTPR